MNTYGGMEVSGQLYAPAALPPGREPPVPIVWKAGWGSELVWTLWGENNLFPLPRIELQAVAFRYTN
jgi:hypothetical protein